MHDQWGQALWQQGSLSQQLLLSPAKRHVGQRAYSLHARVWKYTRTHGGPALRAAYSWSVPAALPVAAHTQPTAAQLALQQSITWQTGLLFVRA